MTPLDPSGRDTLDALMREVERIIAAIPVSDDTTRATEYKLLDRVDQWLHLGVVVDAPDTENTNRAVAHTERWVQDTLVVVLKVQVGRSAGQREIVARCNAHEQAIINTLESDAGLYVYRPEFVRTSRRPGPAGWYESRTTITFERFEVRG